MNNSMPSRQSVMMGQNQSNVPEGIDPRTNFLSKLKEGKSFTDSLPTTQNVDQSKNTPDSNIKSEPKKEPNKDINVIRDYDWTYSKNKNRKLDEIPYIKIKEFKMMGNTYISSLMTTALLFPDIVESNVGQNSFFEKIGSSFKNNSFGKFMGDSVSKVSTAISNTAQKTSNWVTEQMKSIDDTAGSWKSEDLIKNYSYLYLRKATGTTYILPFFNNDFISIRNDFSDTYSGNDKSPIQEVLSRANEVANDVGQYGNVASVTEPGMFVQRPKFYNFRDEGATFATEFYLFNTISPNSYLKNLELITRLIIQNTPHRHNRLLVDPPCIYELTVPGRIFYPYAWIDELTVKHMGTKRILKNDKGKDVSVPDAYHVEIKFKSLTMEVNNFIIPEMGSSGIDVSQRYGVGSFFKGTPPDTTEVSRAQAEDKAKNEAEQKSQQQKNDSGNNTITPRSVQPPTVPGASMVGNSTSQPQKTMGAFSSRGAYGL